MIQKRAVSAASTTPVHARSERLRDHMFLRASLHTWLRVRVFRLCSGNFHVGVGATLQFNLTGGPSQLHAHVEWTTQGIAPKRDGVEVTAHAEEIDQEQPYHAATRRKSSFVGGAQGPRLPPSTYTGSVEAGEGSPLRTTIVKEISVGPQVKRSFAGHQGLSLICRDGSPIFRCRIRGCDILPETERNETAVRWPKDRKTLLFTEIEDINCRQQQTMWKKNVGVCCMECARGWRDGSLIHRRSR